MKKSNLLKMLLLLGIVVGCGETSSSSSNESNVTSSSKVSNVSSSTSNKDVSSNSSSSSDVITNSSSSIDGDVNKGYLKVEVPKVIYSNYPAKSITYSFSNPEYSSSLEYVVSDERLKIENDKMWATGNFENPINVSILVISEHFEAIQFSINVSTFTGGINLETKVQYYEKNIIKEENKGGTIFIGDSYFDGVLSGGFPPFWKDFYTDYSNEPKTFLMGISSQRIEHLEVTSERIVYPMAPKEIILHIGFNDVHSGTFEVDEIYSRIIALCENFKEKLNDVKIYYTGVEPKKNGYTEGSEFYYSSTVKAPALTQKMKDYSIDKDWFVYIDTMDIFVKDGVIKTESYLSSDLSHPTLEAYDEIRKRVNIARGVEKESFSIKQYGSNENINDSGKVFKDASDSDLVNNYVVSGTLEITRLNKNNAYIQFRFSSGSRFLLWDSNNDGVVGIGYMSGSSSKNDKTSGAHLYDANDGLILNWTIIVHDGSAYFYVDKVLKETISNPTLEYFNIGALQMDVEFTNLEWTVKKDNETKYNSLINEYNL